MRRAGWFLLLLAGCRPATPPPGPILVVPTQTGAITAAGGVGHPSTGLQILDGQGGNRWILPPPQLGVQGGWCTGMARWQDITYALCRLNHPVFDRLGDAWFHERQTSRAASLPLALFVRRPGQAWTYLARVDGGTESRRAEFLPLEDGRFLSNLLSGPALAPCRIDQGRLVQDGPSPLPAFVTAREIVRTPAGISVMDARTGQGWLLSNRNGACLREDRFWDAEPESPFPRSAAFAARPDGLLVVARTAADRKPERAPFMMGMYRFARSAAPASWDRLAAARLLQVIQGQDTPQPSPPNLVTRWFLFDPGTGARWVLPPPAGMTATRKGMGLQPILHFLVQANGNLMFLDGADGRGAHWEAGRPDAAH